MPILYVDFSERLTANLDEFQSVADSVQDVSIWLSRPQGDLITINDAVERHLGLPLSVMLEIDTAALVHPKDRKTHALVRQHMKTGGGRIASPTRVWCAARRRYEWVLSHIVPVIGLDRRLLCYLCAGLRFDGGAVPREDPDELFRSLLGLDRRLAPRKAVCPSRQHDIAAQILSIRKGDR